MDLDMLDLPPPSQAAAQAAMLRGKPVPVPQDPLMQQYADLMRQQAEANAAREKAYTAPDRGQMEQAFNKQAQGGGDQMMLALAAGEAGKQMQPFQAQFLKRAAEARGPMKMAGGTMTDTGFIEDPTYKQNLAIQRADAKSRQIEQALQGNITQQSRQDLQREQAKAQADLRRELQASQQAFAGQMEAGRREDRAAALAVEKDKAAAAAKTAAGKDPTAKNAVAGREVLGLLDEAEKYLPNATSSYAGYGVDQGLRVLGKSTKGSQATASLRTVAGQIVAKMPRMEGPQSNYDVQLYTQMAGNLADPTTPLPDKQAALKTLRDLNAKYAAPAAATVPGAGGWKVEVE